VLPYLRPAVPGPPISAARNHCCWGKASKAKKRGLPRHKADLSVFSRSACLGLPTADSTINREAVVGWARTVVAKGGWTGWKSHGRNDTPRAWAKLSVSGAVARLPAMKAGRRGQASRVRENDRRVLRGLADGFINSTPTLPGGGVRRHTGRHRWTRFPLDFGTLEKYGFLSGSGCGHNPVGTRAV